MRLRPAKLAGTVVSAPCAVLALAAAALLLAAPGAAQAPAAEPTIDDLLARELPELPKPDLSPPAPANNPPAPADAPPDAATATPGEVGPPPIPPPTGVSAWPPVGTPETTGTLPPGRAAAGAAPSALEPVRITWRVENPFRFFVDPADTEVHRATYLALSEAERREPVLGSERALARRHEDGWAATMYRKTCWDTSRNRFVCPGGGDYINPSSHAVVAKVEGIAEPSVTCTWSTVPNGGPRPRGIVSRQPCGEPAVLDVPYPGGLDLTVDVEGVEIAREHIKVRDIFVVGIGDSFASGEGNPDVPVRFSSERSADYGKPGGEDDLTGYPVRVGPWKQIGDKAFIDENARWLDQACHRSLYSYQLRTALQLAVEDPHRAVTYAGVSCSGAEVTWGFFLRYKGNEWVPRPPDLSQISAIADAQCGRREAPTIDLPEAYHMQGVIPELQGGLVMRKCPADVARKIDLALVSIGGNDIGFARLVANAVLADQSLVRTLGGWFGQIHGNQEATTLIERLNDRYKSLNRALHGLLHIPWEESDRIVLAAYPPLAVVDHDGSVCPDGRAGMEVLGDFNLTAKSALSSMWLADKLHQVMEKSAASYRWSFAEGHRKAFVGRGLCAGYAQVIPSVADDLRLPRKRNGIWTPYNPADYRPYAPRVRWFRTPNDAFMTGNFHVAGSVIEKVLKFDSLSWFQILLASTYSGAFHPTAEGQAAIADGVTDVARAVAARYEKREQRAASR